MDSHPVLDAQLGILLACSATPQSTAWNLPSVITLGKSVDASRLVDAITCICSSREELHIRFIRTPDGTIRQYADHALPIPVARRQMSEDVADTYIRHGFVKPFDLFGDEALCRFEVIETDSHLYLLSDFHHSIADGYTIAHNLMQTDLPAAYAGCVLAPPAKTLFAWAEEEQQALHTPSYTKARDYFLGLFEDCEATCYVSGTPSSNEGKSTESFSISRQETDRWTEEHHTSAPLLLMAVFSLTLSKLTHHSRVTFSTINHGRFDKRLAHTYGMFVQTVPFVADIATDTTCSDLLTQLRRQWMNTLRHRTYPFTHFCRDSGLIPKISFAFQGDGVKEETIIEGQHYQGVQLAQSSPGDLSVVVYAVDDSYEVRLEAPTSHSRGALRLFAHAMRHALSSLMTGSDSHVSGITLMSDDETARMLRLSAGEQNHHADDTVVSLFLKQCRSTPESVAVDDSRQSLTYSELERQSRALAHWLHTQNTSGPVIGLYATPCAAFLVGALAIMRAGAAYMPIDPHLPPQRQQQLIDDAGITLILDSTAIHTHASSTAPPCPIDHSQPQAPAYIIYTSGTTGRPKGVVIPHAALSNLIHFCVRRWPLTNRSRIACHSSLAFDASVEDLFPVLTTGGCVLLIPEDQRKDLDDIAHFIDIHHVTGGCYTTRLGVALAQSHDLPVDYLCVGGERLTDIPPVQGRVYNTYGPTEFTVDATYYELEKRRTYETIPIGRPLDNCHAFVVDCFGCLLPQGAVGELWLAGSNIALGYWKAPALTEERFTHCTFYHGKVYHTGDLVRWNDEGQLEFIGRKDRQVKIDGIRIALEEIEQQMRCIDGIVDAVVVAPEVNGKPLLTGYFTAHAPLTATEVSEQLRRALPATMVPQRLIALDAMPLTSSGKVAYRQLPMPMAEDTTPPATPLEATLCQLFAEVLGDRSSVGSTDDFFALGGTSILAMQLVTAARQKGYKLHFSDIFTHPTPHQLGLLLEHGGNLHDDDIEQYDYRPIHSLLHLSHDTLFAPLPSGATVLLTGATGFLGIHLLRALIDKNGYEVVCMMRDTDAEQARERLRERWAYYFGEELPSSHLRTVYGDLTRCESVTALTETSFDMVVNCAADVRYFAKDDNITLVNTEGVALLSQLCLATDRPLIHVSTLSVGGTDTNLPPLSPQTLYHHQQFTDQYSRSKFLAERHILSLVLSHHLKARIVRVGYLIPGDNGKTPFDDSLQRIPTLMGSLDTRTVQDIAQRIKATSTNVEQAAKKIVNWFTMPSKGIVCTIKE